MFSFRRPAWAVPVYADPKGLYVELLGHPWTYEPYDFTRDPRELCLRIGGGNMLGGHFVSNTAVVPSAEIGHAFGAVRH